MSPVCDARRVVGGGFPRVSGDEPEAYRGPRPEDAFSPRERG